MFAALLLLRNHTHPMPPVHARSLQKLPDALDWRDYNVVGPVHKQLDCNSCWAFSAAGSIEYWLKRKQPQADINVQNILDCAPNTFGCDGGLMENAFAYKDYYPLHYEYLDKRTPCHHSDKGVHVEHYFSLEDDIEASLAYMIHKWGPVSVAVDFTKQHGYKGGVLTADQCSDTANHAVLAVGYTPDYWILKNSMGTEWGDQGYAYLERNVGACAIETYATVATQVDIK